MTDDPAHPIDGQIVLLTGAKASVPLERIPDLLARAQIDLAGRLDDHRRQYECVHETDERATFLVPLGYWSTAGERLGFGRREADAVRRAHEQQLRRIGREEGREDEFETALEVRQVAVVGRRHHDSA